MDLIASIQDAATEFARLVDGTSPDQLDDPTPCATFTVRDLINHVASGATMFAIAFDKGSVPDDELAPLFGDVLGDDYKGALAAAIDKAATAFTRPGALDGKVSLPFGEFSREALDREVAVDLVSGLLQGEVAGALPMLSSLVEAVSARDRALLDDLERLVAEKRDAIAREDEP